MLMFYKLSKTVIFIYLNPWELFVYLAVGLYCRGRYNIRGFTLHKYGFKRINRVLVAVKSTS